MLSFAPNIGNTTSHFDQVHPPPSWSFIPVFTLVTLFLIVILNSGVLLVFIWDKHLRTPFSVYLMNLLGANIVIGMLQNPLDIATGYAGSWYPGQAACTVYLYGSYAFGGGILIAHVLITTNRIWAICFPFSYRAYHTKKVAVGVCAGMWCYVHVLILPGLIVDGMYYRSSLDVMGCSINITMQREWSEAVHWLVYNLAEIIVVGAYPVICVYRVRSRKAIRHVQTANAAPEQGNHPGTQSSESCHKTSHAAAGKTEKHSYAFMVLTLMTCSVLVFWTPIMVFYGMAPYGHFDLTFYQVARAVYSCESVLDPILFVVAIKDIWRSGRRMVGL